MEERDIRTGESVRQKMEEELGRVAVPAILIGDQVYWGFQENRKSIEDALGVKEENE